MSLTIFTVGHSTRSAEEFVSMLQAHGIQLLVDVRTVAKSRRVPHFNSDELARRLNDADIAYVHMKGLGGLRKPRKDSLNTAWRNESFRGYADYMETEPFGLALESLIALARERKAAVMCAEAVPWRCHRSLIADALVLLHGAAVLHIMSAAKANPHQPTEFARAAEGKVTYPAAPGFFGF